MTLSRTREQGVCGKEEIKLCSPDIQLQEIKRMGGPAIGDREEKRDLKVVLKVTGDGVSKITHARLRKMMVAGPRPPHTYVEDVGLEQLEQGGLSQKLLFVHGVCSSSWTALSGLKERGTT